MFSVLTQIKVFCLVTMPIKDPLVKQDSPKYLKLSKFYLPGLNSKEFPYSDVKIL